MERIALHTRLKPGRQQDHEDGHAVIPRELDPALREAGVTNWRIWRDGLDLFGIVECEPFRTMRDHLREHPANLLGQARMAELLEVADDYDRTDRGLRLAWELP
jgi:L-rhamnose mutarotase